MSKQRLYAYFTQKDVASREDKVLLSAGGFVVVSGKLNAPSCQEESSDPSSVSLLPPPVPAPSLPVLCELPSAARDSLASDERQGKTLT